MVRVIPGVNRLITLGLNPFFQYDSATPATVDLLDNFGNASAAASLDPSPDASAPASLGPSSVLPRPKTEAVPQPHYLHSGVRTADDARVPAAEALEQLQEGNKRFVSGESRILANLDNTKIKALAEFGQAPMASILGCADSRAPVELLFDMTPGDLFVLRNAGNTFSNAESSMVGSLEFSVNALGVKLVLVLGHTKCGAIKGATATMLASQADGPKAPERALDTLLAGLGPVAEQAQLELGGSADADAISCKAVRVNIFDGIEKLLVYSDSIREKVSSGDVQVHGAMYDIETGAVEFLGQHPRLPLILGMQAILKK